MNEKMRVAVREMMTQFGSLVKDWAQQAEGLQDAASLKSFEGRLREEGLALLGKTLEGLLQAALDGMPEARTCPQCGRRRRHKGRRERGLISSIGAIRLTGPYWYCRRCVRACVGRLGRRLGQRSDAGVALLGWDGSGEFFQGRGCQPEAPGRACQ